MENFVMEVLSNFPTFAGLLVLAYVLYIENQRCEDARARQSEVLEQMLMELIELRDKESDA